MGWGEQGLLTRSLTALFASRKCPDSAIRAAMDWALEQARARMAVISGLHSPLEQSVLARPVIGARLKPEWKAAVAEGRMVVVSASTETQRLNSERAVLRNDLVAQLAEHIVIAHASANGGLIRQSESWKNRGLRVSFFC